MVQIQRDMFQNGVTQCYLLKRCVTIRYFTERSLQNCTLQSGMLQMKRYKTVRYKTVF